MKRLWQVLRVLLSLGLIAWLVYSLDFSSLEVSASPQAVLYALLALVVAFGDRILMVYKWDVLLKARDIRLPFGRLTGQYLSATFLGLFLPATLGADAVRAYAVARDGVDLEDVISSILIERVIGVVALLVFVVISIFLSLFIFGEAFYSTVRGVLLTAALLLAALLIVGALSMNRQLLRWLNSKINRLAGSFRANRYYLKLREIYASYLKYQDHRPALVIFLMLSFLENLFPIAMSYLLALALDIRVPVLFFFILVPIVLLLVRIPISIDGFGIQEGSFVFFLGLVGVAGPAALLLGVLTHVASILSVLPGGVLYGLYGLNPKKSPELSLAAMQEHLRGELGDSQNL